MSERLPWFRCFPSALLGAMAGLTPDEGYTYVALLLRIYETGGPVAETARTLARRTGLSERRVAAALETLLASGKVSASEEGRLDSGSTHDEIAWQEARRADASTAGRASAEARTKQSAKKNFTSFKANDKNQRQEAKQNQQTGATPVQQPCNHLDLEEEKESSEATPLHSLRESWPKDAWAQFWALYPRKVGKPDAVKRFDRTRRSRAVTFDRLMAGLRAYLATNPDPEFIPHPATWLNKGRWDDEHLPPRPPPPNGGNGRPTETAAGRRWKAGTAGLFPDEARHGQSPDPYDRGVTIDAEPLSPGSRPSHLALVEPPGGQARYDPRDDDRGYRRAFG